MAAAAACLCAGLVAAVLVPSAHGTRIAEIYVFAVAALAAGALLLRIASALPRATPALPQSPPQANGLRQLESMQRKLDLAELSAFDLHHGLRPIVRDIAAARLARHGVALDRQPARARALLGEDAWELARADREAPLGRSGVGYGREELRAIVDALEAV